MIDEYIFEVILLPNTCFLQKQVFKSNITLKICQSKVDDKKIN